jgi:hypothetical protein
MEHFFRPKQIELSMVGELEISTTQIYRKVWETCLFYADGSSQVVGSFDSEEEARRSHRFLVDHEIMHRIMQRHPEGEYDVFSD